MLIVTQRRATRDVLLAIQSKIRAEQVHLGLPRKKSRFADLIAKALVAEMKR